MTTPEPDAPLYDADQMRAYGDARAAAAVLAEQAKSEAMRAALKWYADESAALAKHIASGIHGDAVLASVTVLSLDAGQRAAAAIRAEPKEKT